MSRVNLSGERVNEIVLNEKDVPGVDEVDGGIVPDLEVTIQSEEPFEGTVDGVVEGNGIETIEEASRRKYWLSLEVISIASPMPPLGAWSGVLPRPLKKAS